MPIRILLDECLPRRLKNDLCDHNVMTVPEMGWASKKNGELLRLAEQQFDVFLTMDQHLAFQQNIPTFSLAILCLNAPSNRYGDVLPLMAKVEKALIQIQPGQLIHLA